MKQKYKVYFTNDKILDIFAKNVEQVMKTVRTLNWKIKKIIK